MNEKLNISEQSVQVAVETEHFELSGPTPKEEMLWRARHHVGFKVGCVVTAFFILVAIFAPFFTDFSPYTQNLNNRLIPPVWSDGGSTDHLFGTDQFGRDYLTRVIFGARVSLMIGFLVAAVSAIVGSIIGLIGGYYGGKIDTVVMYLINVKLALPGLVVALSLIAAFGGSVLVLVLTLTFLFWDRYAVVLRSLTLRIREFDYITAARAVGASDARIAYREILPNVFNEIIVIASLEIAIAILVEAALSFLGLGIQPPTPSWGLLVAEGRKFMFVQPNLIVIPGLAIFLLVIAINMLGDGIRDITSSSRRN